MNSEEISELRVLVARSRAGRLTGPDQARYQEAFLTLERSLNQAQLLLAPKGAQARRSFRVACELDVDLSLGSSRHRGRAQTLSVGGFSAIVAEQIQVGSEVPSALYFPSGPRPLEAIASCRAVVRLGALWRACFAFHDLPTEVAERLKVEVLDLVLELLWPAPRLEG